MKKETLIRYFVLLLLFSMNINAQEKKAFLEKGKQELFYGKPKKSIVLLEKALHQYQKEKNDAKIAESHNQLSKAYRSLYELKKAMHHANKALEICRREDVNKREEANSLDNIALIHSIMKQSEKALKLHKEALKIRFEFYPKDSLSQVVSFYNIGNLFASQNEFEKGYNYLHKALKIKVRQTPENQMLIVDVNLAISNIYYDQGKFDDALIYLEKGLLLAREVFDKGNIYFINIYNKLGVIYSMKEELHESFKYYQKVLSVSISNYGVDEHLSQAMVHFNIGTIYQKQGLTEKALFHTRKSFELGIKILGENHESLAFPYSQMGQIYGDEQGIPYLKKALNLLEESSNKPPLHISYLHEYLTIIYTKIKDYSKAMNHAKKALKIRLNTFGEDNTHSIRTNNLISNLYTILENYDLALTYNQKAIESNELQKIDEDLLLESIKIKADIYFKLYEESAKKEHLEESVNLYKRAIPLINLARERKRNYDDKIKFSETVKSIYAKNIKTSLLLHQLDENNSLRACFNYSEMSKANVLRELMKNTEIKQASSIPDEIIATENLINTNISKLTSEILKEVAHKKRDSQKVYHLEGLVLDETRRRDSLEKSIETNFPMYHKLKYQNHNISVSEIQEKLNENSTFIEFFQSDDIVYVFVISKKSFHVKELTIKDLDDRIQELNTSVIDKNDSAFFKKSFKLYQLLLKPIEEYLVGDHLIIIPDESLWHLQFDMLLTEENKEVDEKRSYLLYKYAVSYGNTASLFFDDSRKRKKKTMKNECIAFSYTNDESKGSNSSISLRTLRNSEADLPGTRKEILEISKIFNGTYYYGESANEENFKSNLERYKVVHLALHGEIDHTNPKNSKIYFTDTEGKKQEDNILFGHELYALNISADLVVLSACNTGSGQVNKGEGILSLGNAFQYAGAESLLLSRWKISDKTTPEIIKYFYRNLSKGMNKSSALQKAKVEFLERSDVFQAAPFYWGSFYILGNIDPIPFEESKTNYVLMLSFLLGSFLLFLLVRKIALRGKK